MRQGKAPPKVLRVIPATKFQKIWKDKGSGARNDVTLFRPCTDEKGYHRLGDLALPYHADYPLISNPPLCPLEKAGEQCKKRDEKHFLINSHTTTQIPDKMKPQIEKIHRKCKEHFAWNNPVLMVKEVNPDFQEYLRKPVDYEFMWDETRTGAYTPVTIWKPKPPPGFVALGFVATSDHTKPDLDLVRCVHKSVTIPGAVSDANIWPDTGSKGKYDITLWGVLAANSDGKSTGTFVGIDHHLQKHGLSVRVLDARAILTTDHKKDEAAVYVSSSEKCPKCNGLCGIGAFGPCEVGSIHYIVTCPTCHGQGNVGKNLVMCSACEGYGGLSTAFGKCDITSLHYTACNMCHGSCYSPV